MGSPAIRPLEMKRWETVPKMIRETTLVTESQMIHTSPPKVPVASPSRKTEELWKDMRQVVDLMKDLSLNLMNNASGRGRGKPYHGPSDGPPEGGSGSGYYAGRRLPTCFKCDDVRCSGSNVKRHISSNTHLQSLALTVHN